MNSHKTKIAKRRSVHQLEADSLLRNFGRRQTAMVGRNTKVIMEGIRELGRMIELVAQEIARHNQDK